MSEDRKFASWGVRVAAGLVDVLLVLAVSLLLRLVEIPIRSAWMPDFAEVGHTLGAADFIAETKHKLQVLIVINSTLLTLTLIANTVVLQGITGQSLGKKLLRIHIVGIDPAHPIGVGRTLLRQLAHLLDALPCYLGYLWPIWDPQRQTFADKLTGTLVVPVGESQPQPTTASHATYQPAAIAPQPTPVEQTGGLDTNRSSGAALPTAEPPQRDIPMIVGGVVTVLLVAAAVGTVIVLNDSSDDAPSPPPLATDTVMYSVYSQPDSGFAPDVTGIAVDTTGTVFTASLGGTTEAPAPHRHFGSMESVAIGDDGAVYIDTDTGLTWKLGRDNPALSGPTGNHLSGIPSAPESATFSESVLSAMSEYMADDLRKGCRITVRSGIAYQACLGAVFKLPTDADSSHAAPTRLPFTVDENHAPGGIAVDNAGAVYLTVTEYKGAERTGKVLKLAPGAGRPSELPFEGLLGTGGIAVDDAGTVHVADPDNGRVLALLPGSSSATTEATFPPTTDRRHPTAVTADHSGAVYVAVSDSALKSTTIHKLTPQVHS